MIASLGYQLDTVGRGNFIEKLSLSDWPRGHFLDGSLMEEGPAHLPGIILEQVGIGCIRQVAECEPGSKPIVLLPAQTPDPPFLMVGL